ncbi:DUF4240 domain-containing protein [Kineosporia sp. A_224]|uniref:DUF4240 domain-containing protein n=1 Tax=Kineosporia sp. A_224 TaxID=1962180 RepID=UPI000B4B5AD7|nr:DUF4240 domain-containing protein [Kineosporia sp. A_224]
MDEDRFWELVAVLGGRADAESCHRLYLELRRTDTDTVVAFGQRLHEVLHRLDLRSIAAQRWRAAQEPWWMPRIPGISADGFLYARCAAVGEGRATVEAVLADHRLFKRRWDMDGEFLLGVVPEAYAGCSGRDWYHDHHGRADLLDYETGSNPDGGWRRDGFPAGNPQ